jgi:hypothetical protein
MRLLCQIRTLWMMLLKRGLCNEITMHQNVSLSIVLDAFSFSYLFINWRLLHRIYQITPFLLTCFKWPVVMCFTLERHLLSKLFEPRDFSLIRESCAVIGILEFLTGNSISRTKPQFLHFIWVRFDKRIKTFSLVL